METCYETLLFVSVCKTPFLGQATADQSIIMFSYHHLSGLNDAWMDEKHASNLILLFRMRSQLNRNVLLS